MNIEDIRDFCLMKQDVTEGLPFGPDTLVFKADNKVFALVSLDGDPSVNLKCDPQLALELRERYDSVLPGYHMNKKHWNTVNLNGSVPDEVIMEWINHSYELVSGKKQKH